MRKQKSKPWYHKLRRKVIRADIRQLKMCNQADIRHHSLFLLQWYLEPHRNRIQARNRGRRVFILGVFKGYFIFTEFRN